jgi:hypothetical protein
VPVKLRLIYRTYRMEFQRRGIVSIFVVASLNNFISVTLLILIMQAHQEMFNDSLLQPYLENVVIRSDEDRLNEVCCPYIIVNKAIQR